MLDYFIKGVILDTGRLKITVCKFNFIDLLSEVIQEVQFIHPDYQLVFRHASEILLYADRDRIGQVIENLLTNAIKYSAKKDRIIITCKNIEDQVQISVKDNGIGLRDGELTKVFDKYYRIENVLENAIPGYGIGLYLCKQIIDEHNGRIWVESGGNSGSTFYFTLPLVFNH
ncbi:signal transduction histidine kinase [Mucilaginibacter sp. UYP25]|uniref:sensor histidine kinase n=1 Tax=unclassified Mucilaginibacter TaxID=2617802 RepID=UPI003399F493